MNIIEFDNKQPKPKFDLRQIALDKLRQRNSGEKKPEDPNKGKIKSHLHNVLGGSFLAGFKGEPAPKVGSFTQIKSELDKNLKLKNISAEKKNEIAKILPKVKKQFDRSNLPPADEIENELKNMAPNEKQKLMNSPEFKERAAKYKQVHADVTSALINLGYKKNNVNELITNILACDPYSIMDFDTLFSLVFASVPHLTFIEPGSHNQPSMHQPIKQIKTVSQNAPAVNQTVHQPRNNIKKFNNLKPHDRIRISSGKNQGARGTILKLNNEKALVRLLNGNQIFVPINALKTNKKINNVKTQSESKIMTKPNRTVTENLLKLRAKRFIAEGEMENAEAALAAKDLVDRLQDSIEEVSKMANEELPHLVDAIRNSFGQEKATAYQTTANSVLGDLLTIIKEKKAGLETATLTLTGDAAPAGPADGLALPDGESDDMGMGDDSELDNDLSADAGDELETSNKKTPLGRGTRPEAENESKVNRGNKLAEAKKTAKKKPEWLTKAEEKNEKKEGKKVDEAKTVHMKKCASCKKNFAGTTAKCPACKKDEKKKNVAEAAIRTVLKKACPECKAKAGEKCKHLKSLKESKNFAGLHITRWQSTLTESVASAQKKLDAAKNAHAMIKEKIPSKSTRLKSMPLERAMKRISKAEKELQDAKAIEAKKKADKK